MEEEYYEERKLYEFVSVSLLFISSEFVAVVMIGDVLKPTVCDHTREFILLPFSQ